VQCTSDSTFCSAMSRPCRITADGASLRGKRDYATLAILLGCGLRRAELTALRVEDVQQREKHWVIADLVGKGDHIRSIPVPDWVKAGIDAWMGAAGIFVDSTPLADFTGAIRFR
jgi:integrase